MKILVGHRSFDVDTVLHPALPGRIEVSGEAVYVDGNVVRPVMVDIVLDFRGKAVN